MRARVLSIEPGRPQDIEDELNDFLSKAGPVTVEHLHTISTEGRLAVALIIFYSEPRIKVRPAQVCAQCKKKAPMPGLKTCEECRDYQRDYRQKRKTESKARYP